MKQTIIIFEGPDQVGKSTIAKALSLKTKIPLFKVQRNKYFWDPDISLRYLTEGITQFIEQTGVSVILDRWVASDYMYSKLFNRHISYDIIKNIDARLSDLNAIIIVCYKREEGYLHDEEDKAFISMKDYDKMKMLYREYASITKCKIHFLDTTDQNLKNQLNEIIKLCE